MNSFGRVFRITIFGESHGFVVGINIDGCPAGIPLTVDDFTNDLSRRRAGKEGTTPRVEDDIPELVSGWFNGYTTGAPLTIFFNNKDIRSGDYANLKDTPRPGHADFVARQKFNGFNDYRGGGHFSGRLTLALVAAGVVAKKIIPKISINALLIEAGGNTNIAEAVSRAREAGDSIGGMVECRADFIPVGYGEPFFDSVESVISHLAFSIPAIKGIEFGSGFSAARMTGLQHNDPIINELGRTATANAGGITGGITNGNELVFRVAVKPASSIPKLQQTFSFSTHTVEELKIEGRHDVCIALRVPVILEAITAIVLADFMLVSGKEYKNKRIRPTETMR
ncbi:MAG: chorismate synthase [Bacteroidales bacterium]|jgi:chorismate synthase|nr:chorismate synthase [Bacteroidales bacterium]MDD2264821.1 chorismate synthase [Bacteroidales bacterium]MDD2832081.1 chorismate synthase [Bacteroidales bacterium]MDD3208725.1 chorismate synthase [Bacteroidales bacterium]MDD3697288.1 chorismate synthase [Bacteroidales bacterium]